MTDNMSKHLKLWHKTAERESYTHTLSDLRVYQALPLELKIQMTLTRIRAWGG